MGDGGTGRRGRCSASLRCACPLPVCCADAGLYGFRRPIGPDFTDLAIPLSMPLKIRACRG